MKASAILTTWIVGLLSVTPCYAQPDEVVVGPVSISQDVNGISVAIVATSYFKVRTVDGRAEIKARAVGDLSDLQSKIGAIVDTFELPTQNCRSYSADNPVVSISRKELLFRDGTLMFSIGGNVTMWDCRENPIPNSKVEWEIKDVGFGIKTKVPVVVTWPGDPIKSKLVSQSFDADLPLRIGKTDDYSVELVLGRPDIELKGQFAFITEGVLSIAGVDINAKAEDALRKAIDQRILRASVPDEFLQYGPTIESARFFDDAGHLKVEIGMNAMVQGSTITQFIAELLKLGPRTAQ
ncbi:hypothetical protein [Mesorhizobium sp. L48C026A00]|uniref:hypothetical protein n=1 Tax=Mesorhizobium sp. L48C026A00 TaxID=1287182 RepID=UPI0003CFB7B1|nr:hypothetical protein [Mesorhizobium sp. L48C026A00]ESZ10158.1 hypothetical protein X737_32160 [Mesorhizobium sp. L48C026A00]